MFTKNELLDAIDDLEIAPATYQNCEKLATFYSLYDHLYGSKRAVQETIRETIIGNHGASDFLGAIAGKDAQKAFAILDELMETVRLLQPRLYEATMAEINDLKRTG